MSDDKIEQMLSEIKQSLNQLRISRSAGTSIGGSVNVNDGGDFVAHDQYNLQQNIQIITLDYFAPRIRDRLLECKSLSEMDDILMQIPDRANGLTSERQIAIFREGLQRKLETPKPDPNDGLDIPDAVLLVRVEPSKTRVLFSGKEKSGWKLVTICSWINGKPENYRNKKCNGWKEVLGFVLEELQKLRESWGVWDRVFIEFFLPIDFLNEPFYDEHFRKEEIGYCLGEDFVVLVRSSEMNAEEDLKRYWEQVEKQYDESIDQIIWEHDLKGNCPDERLHCVFKENCLGERVSVLFLHGLPQESCVVMRHIVASQIPIAIWWQEDHGASLSFEGTLGQLPWKVKEKRKNNRGIILYWNDPSRLFPKKKFV